MTVIDPRRFFATAERFPAVTLDDRWPDEAMAALAPRPPLPPSVTLTHDPKLDDPALDAALRTEAFYIGALGSRRTHAARLWRASRRSGTAPEALARIRGPVGLAHRGGHRTRKSRWRSSPRSSRCVAVRPSSRAHRPRRRRDLRRGRDRPSRGRDPRPRPARGGARAEEGARAERGRRRRPPRRRHRARRLRAA
ncbi:MAG: XdhC family protein [Acetobacteraceae bacterium]|nr:XdhC family protein [Acetobacteraceae bacterium]